MNSLGLYIHIPFCRSKCGYCDFHSRPAADGEYERYETALVSRIRALRGEIRDFEIDSVYFGGGTPSLMPEDKLRAVLLEIKAYTITTDAEITLEANPGTVCERSLSALRRAGFNRISFGMQSAVDLELRAIGRLHGERDTDEAFQAARRAGFDNISLDLMLGLPGQTRDSLERSISAAVRAEHISAYILKLEPGTPLAKAYPNGTMGDDETAELYLYCCERLADLGYRQYEISNFARPGYASRHNLRYWTLKDYIGLGPAAHSFFKGKRFFFPRDTESFIRGSRACAFTGAEEEETDLVSEYIMLSLRTAAGISGKRLSELGADREKIFAVLEKYEKYGYARRTGDGFRLTPKGFLISNTIIADALPDD